MHVDKKDNKVTIMVIVLSIFLYHNWTKTVRVCFKSTWHWECDFQGTELIKLSAGPVESKGSEWIKNGQGCTDYEEE